MVNFLKKHKDLGWLSLFLVVGGLYFLSQQLPLDHRSVHCALDDKIPFLPAFCIPYVLWWLYIPGMMLYMCFRDPAIYHRQVLTVFPGILLCTLIFFIYPTCIDFRPMSEGTGFFRWVCRFLYANDRPMNVFPSLHCFEAIAVHLATFASGYGKAHRAFQIGSAVLVVLICLSTVFIKQHSVLDVLGGAAVACTMHALAGFILKKRRTSHDHPAL